MKKFTYKNLLGTLLSKSVLLIAGSAILVSCGTQMGGYTETDGVYYDPNKDTLPEGTITNEVNQVGKDYVYGDVQNDENVKYSDVLSSDWGLYSGTETNYYNDYWGYPYGFGYSPWRWSVGFGFGWGSPWFGYNSYWDYGYYPYYNYGFSPYWGYYGYSPYYYGYGYNPYYGYGYASPFRSQRSGADGRLYNSYNQGGLNRQSMGSGFRNQNALRTTNQARPAFRNQQNGSVNPRYNNQGVINQSTVPRQSQPRYRSPQSAPVYENRTRSYDNGGFRSGSERSGGFNNSSGSTRSSSSGTRNGGFR